MTIGALIIFFFSGGVVLMATLKAAEAGSSVAPCCGLLGVY